MNQGRVALLHLAFHEYTASLARELDALVDLTVIHPTSASDEMARMLPTTAARKTFNKPRFRDPSNLKMARTLIHMLRGFDLVHVQQAGDPWVDLALSAGLAQKTIVTVHDVSPHSGDGDRIPGSFVARRRLHRRAAGLIVHTSDMATQLEADSPAPIGVIPHPSTRRSFVGNDEPPVLAPGNRKDVLFFGRIWPYKGLDLLIAAMRLVVDRVDGARLVIAGRGANVEELVPDVPWIALHNRFIPNSEVASFFESSAVVALPYRDATQSGVGVMAIDFRRPVVASPVGGLPSLFADPHGGRSGASFVDPTDAAAMADAIVQLLTDDDEYALAQSALSAVAETIDPRVVAEETADFYAGCLARLDD